MAGCRSIRRLLVTGLVVDDGAITWATPGIAVSSPPSLRVVTGHEDHPRICIGIERGIEAGSPRSLTNSLNCRH